MTQESGPWSGTTELGSAAERLPTADGRVAVTVGRLDGLARLLLLIGREELTRDARFGSCHDLVVNRAALVAEIAQELVAVPRDECLALLNAAEITAEAVEAPNS
ncbi:CoA transferase [Streptomyces pristinaespiralis]|nr:CoA transferase [Streptomyces pristinaespiralis]ALC18712.1 L-carnitine dehydratase [Streptomyces pristinaespiralis]QMU18125.1 CoA transferase [Streptomyces pristinaespiralis]